MPEILIGTSGFYYDDWKGAFYPAELNKKDFLGYYTQHFKVLELNFSYYKIPSPNQSRQMLSKSMNRLEFVVKANRQMTHEISDLSLEKTVPMFIEGISPFVEAGKLRAILLQFPQSFLYNKENRVYLKSLIEALNPFPLFVEFRRMDWLKESVYETLHELGVGLVSVDEPSLPSLLPPSTVVTADSAYIRFHGRNKKNWYGTDSTERYDYLYKEEELGEWVSRIESMTQKAKKLFVFFNNHAKAQAVTNAKMLMNLIGK